MSQRLIVVDVESDGGCPGKYSMVCFGAVMVEDKPSDQLKTFYGDTKPISANFLPNALAISGFTREQHLGFTDPIVTMRLFEEWLEDVCGEHRPVFISDNPAFDFQWINYYFMVIAGKENPFGHSSRRIGDLYCGMKMDLSKNKEWKKKLRKTVHDHNPVNDSKGNSESLIAILKQFNLGSVLL